MKQWILLIFAAVFLLVLAACGNSESESSGSESGPTDAEETADERQADPLDGGQVEETSENETGTEEEDANAEGEQVEEDKGADQEDTSNEVLVLTVDMMDSDGNSVGTAEVAQAGEGVEVTLNLTDLEAGTHGIHFHETGMCEGPDFESAGDHFNPTDASHGLSNPEGPHAGDLENIEVAEDGTSQGTIMAENVTLESGADNSLVKEGGTALVIHESADDGETQPSGESGARIACGVIEASQ